MVRRPKKLTTINCGPGRVIKIDSLTELPPNSATGYGARWVRPTHLVLEGGGAHIGIGCHRDIGLGTGVQVIGLKGILTNKRCVSFSKQQIISNKKGSLPPWLSGKALQVVVCVMGHLISKCCVLKAS